MEDTELLAALDEHMRSAADRLDAAIGDPPDMLRRPVQAGRGRSARPVLVAAVVLVVALVGAVVVLTGNGGDGEESTVAGEPEGMSDTGVPTRLALANPEELGFELYDAIDGPNSPPGAPDADEHLSAQAPADARDPWASAALVVSEPAPTGPIHQPGQGELMRWLEGEVIDLDGVEAVVPPIGSGTTIVWLEGDAMHRLSSTRLARDELIDVAATAVRDGYQAGEALPGFDVLYRGRWEDFHRTLDPPEFSRDLDVIAYHHPDGLDFAITSETGNEAAFHTPLVTADIVEHTTIRGQDAVVTADGVEVVVHTASWREPDGTIVRLSTLADLGELLNLIEPALQPIDHATFTSILEATQVPDGERVLRPLEAGDPGREWNRDEQHFLDDPELLAGIAQTVNGVRYRTGIVRQRLGNPRLATLVNDGRKDSTTGTALPGLETLILEAWRFEGSANGHVVGVIPPGAVTLEVVDRNTGEIMEPLDVRTVPIDGTSWQLLSAVVNHDGTSIANSAFEITVNTIDGPRRYRL